MVTAPAPSSADAAGELTDEDERAATEIRERVRRGRVVTAVVVLVLLALVALVAALGGFAQRHDRRTPVAVGAVVTTGPYEVTIDKASVHHVTSEDTWDVVATGTARTTGTTSIRPYSGSSGFMAARSDLTHEAQDSKYIKVNDTGSIDNVDVLTPGLPPVPWSVEYSFAKDPGNEIVIGIFGQVYTTPYIFGDEMGWEPTLDASTVTLPMERLPDKEF